MPHSLRVVDVIVEPLSIPLREPFVIASGRMTATRAVLVEVVIEDVHGHRGRGLGEAAALPPVTPVDQPELLTSLTASAATLRGGGFSGHASLKALVDEACGGTSLVARAAVESALLFAWADLLCEPMHRLLGSRRVDDPVRGFSVDTDITIPIGTPAHMAGLCSAWADLGFFIFKVKVGRSADDGGALEDGEALAAIASVVPHARLRLDGNAGQTVTEARALFHLALQLGLTVELLEQPTPKADALALAELSTMLPVPVVADESAGSYEDARALVDLGVTGINLKLVKHGGPVEAARIGRLCRRRRVSLMAGAMVETRVGLTAMFHVLRALAPGRAAVDLDTAFLLTDDPFCGGFTDDGPRLRLLDHGVLRGRSRPPTTPIRRRLGLLA